jgi:hypothetical protein
VKFLKTAKQSFTAAIPPLSMALHGHLSIVDSARSVKVIHASDLTNEKDEYCSRRAALMTKLLRSPRPRRLTTSESVTFRIGRDLQDSVVDWFSELEMVIGDWECASCKHLHSFVFRPKNCKNCKGPVLINKEMRFKSKKNGASCGVDLALGLPGTKKLTAIEIKTIDKDQFKKLVAPLAEHRLRTNFYLRLIEEQDDHRTPHFQTDYGIVFYVSKGGYGCKQEWVDNPLIKDNFSPFKEYEVKRDDAKTNRMAELAIGYHHYRETGVMPAGVCQVSTALRVKNCEVAKECWSGDYPAKT